MIHKFRFSLRTMLAAVALLCLALSGCSPTPKAVTYPLKAACPMCNGDGMLADHETGKVHPCGECGGTGERPTYEWEKRIPCEACKEAGQIGGVECESCSGLGWIPKYEFKDGIAPPPPANGVEGDDGSECYGRIGDRWRNRPKPIQVITNNAKETTANGAKITGNLIIIAGLVCIGGPLALLALVVGRAVFGSKA